MRVVFEAVQVPAFRHLAPTGHEDIPALADLLGLREHTPQQPTV